MSASANVTRLPGAASRRVAWPSVRAMAVALESGVVVRHPARFVWPDDRRREAERRELQARLPTRTPELLLIMALLGASDGPTVESAAKLLRLAAATNPGESIDAALAVLGVLRGDGKP